MRGKPLHVNAQMDGAALTHCKSDDEQTTLEKLVVIEIGILRECLPHAKTVC